jgi:hypothetical protein
MEPRPDKRYSAQLQLVDGERTYEAEVVEVRSNQLVVEVASALAPGSRLSLIGNLQTVGLHMELRSGAKVAHCRPCGQDCYQIVLELTWSDLDVQRSDDSDQPAPGYRAASNSH